MRKAQRLFTVAFFVDGNHGVETFVEHVKAPKAGDAFDKAVAKVKRSEAYMCGSYEFENATEIATFDGHLEQSSYA